jgi:hypothetical protein
VYLLLIQILSAVCLTLWSAVMTLFILWLTNTFFVKIRLDPEHELLGCDLAEHWDDEDDVRRFETAVSATTMENILTAVPQKYICPCQATNSEATNDNLNKRRAFYINKSFEH